MRRELYTRPDKPLTVPLRKREEPKQKEPPTLAAPLIVDKATECHVTPPEVAARMVAIFGGCGDKLTLEPSAGTGALIQALYDAGQSKFEVVAVERHVKLARALDRFGCGVWNECFLEYAERAQGKIDYPQIIMNPPFRQVRQHMNAALSLLGRGGHDSAQLVALVPVTYDHPEAQTIETLGPDTFSTARVNTKIILIER